MATREEYLALFDLSKIRALEFGPADRPLVPASSPGARYIDHLTTEELRKKMATQPFYDASALCEIHFVNDGRPLAQILGDWVDLDLVAASHVIEHIPNVLGWLQDIAGVLSPTGHLFLVVPNKHYVFDYFRPVSTLPDVISDYLEKRIKPSPRAVFGHMLNAVKHDNYIIWGEGADPKDLVHCHAIEEAWSAGSNCASPDGPYMDVHVSVFTPYSFVQLLIGLTQMGLMPLELERIDQTGFEFFALLKSCPASERIEERIAGLRKIASDLRFDAEDYYVAEFVSKERRMAEQQNAFLRGEIDQLRESAAELDRVKKSASWKLTKPLRGLRRIFR